MVAGTVRGYDGTGYVFKTHNRHKKEENIWFHKEAATGSEINRIGSTPAAGGIEWAFGHNRAATVGAVDDAGAHPFDTAHIIGIHNGTLTNGWKQRLKAKKSIVVDSEALMRSISHRGPDKTLPVASGAMAIVYVDKRTNRLYLFRNSERPVHWCTTKQGSLFWASEGKMLEWLLDRNHQVIDGEMNTLEPDILYDITDGKLKEVDVFEDTGTPHKKSNFSKWDRKTQTYTPVKRDTSDAKDSTEDNPASSIIYLPNKSNRKVGSEYYEQCTACDKLLANEAGMFEMGYGTYKYYLCDNQSCVEQMKTEHGQKKIHTPTTFYNRKGRKPNAALNSFLNLELKFL